ncbi:MAG TPA: trypsin-like peptidase domain-containing protein [Gemmataceae bacterium]|jgi:S1-C subfamily serine protease|nr:trypsin-like peptidase domain-containing protein [Gemmataceae bacterium]
MSVVGTLSPEGIVQVHCPRSGCTAMLKVKPKSNRTWVTCAAEGCRHRFLLEVPELDAAPVADGPPPSTELTPPGPVPPPIPKREPTPPNPDTFALQNLDEPVRDKPKPARSNRDRDREPIRRRREEEKSGGGKIALIVGGGIAAFLLLAGGVTAFVIYANRDKSTSPAQPGPVAQNSNVNQQPIITPPFDPFKANSVPVAKPKTSTTNVNPAKTPETPIATDVTPNAEPDKPKTEPDTPTPDEPKPGLPVPKKGMPKKGRPSFEAPVPVGPATELPGDSKAAIEKVKKSTALIEVKGGWGTGFVIRPGIVMTNFHVISGAMLDELKVSFVSLDDTAPAPLKPTLLFCDPRRDLAILRVDTDRPPLEMCSAGTELQGLAVAVVGNPRGNGGQAAINKVTTGKVAAPVRRNAEWTYFELNAPAFFGNSGGPVVDLKTGKLVGVMQSILGDGKLTSYCIPYGEANRALDRLPTSTDMEPAAAKIAAGRHYLEFAKTKLPIIEKNAAVAMRLQLAILDSRGGSIDVFFDNGEQFTATEIMNELKDTHAKTHAQLSKLVNGPISASQEVPSALKSALRLRLETCGSMRDLASSKTETRNAFVNAMTNRKAANDRNIKSFETEYDKFLDNMDKPKAK